MQHRHVVPQHGSACAVLHVQVSQEFCDPSCGCFETSRLFEVLKFVPEATGTVRPQAFQQIHGQRKPCISCARPATTHLRTLAHFRDVLFATCIRIATGQKLLRSDSRKSRFRRQRIVSAPVLYGVISCQGFCWYSSDGHARHVAVVASLLTVGDRHDTW